MRTTLDLPDDLFRKAKAKAALEGTSLKNLITRFIEDGLNPERRPSNEVAMRPRSQLKPLPASGRTIPALSNADIDRLLDDEDIHRAARH